MAESSQHSSFSIIRYFYDILAESYQHRHSIEFLHNLKFPAKSGQDPAGNDMQWVATIECQYWQGSDRVWQKVTNYRETRMTSHDEL